MCLPISPSLHGFPCACPFPLTSTIFAYKRRRGRKRRWGVTLRSIIKAKRFSCPKFLCFHRYIKKEVLTTCGEDMCSSCSVSEFTWKYSRHCFGSQLLKVFLSSNLPDQALKSPSGAIFSWMDCHGQGFITWPFSDLEERLWNSVWMWLDAVSSPVTISAKAVKLMDDEERVEM